MAASSSTIYTKLSSITFSDFTPSRVTRISSNPFLQEHDPIYSSIARRYPRPVSCGKFVPCSGKYISVDFTDYRPRSKNSKEGSEASHHRALCCAQVPCGEYYSSARLEASPSLKKQAIDGISCDDHSKPYSFDCLSLDPHCFPQESMALEVLQTDKRSRTSFAIAVDENPVVFDDTNVTPTANAPRAVECAVQQSRRLKPIKPEARLLRSPPPLPPKGVRPFADTATTFATKQSSDADGEQHYTLSLSPGEERRQLADAPAVKGVVVSAGRNCRSPSSSLSPSPPSSQRIVTTKPLCTDDCSPCLCHTEGNTNIDRSVTQSMEDPQHSTPYPPKPIPPPRSRRKRNHDFQSPDTPTARNASNDTRPTKTNSSPLNFLDTNVGEECGRFFVDYLGSRETDQFIGIVDECAMQMMNSKPPARSTQVVAYVTTERIRLAPPKAGPLFKSLAVKSILSVDQCSKNKRIIGVVIWKPRTKPVCHLLRSSDQLISNGLFEALSHVIQNLDDELLSKVGPLVQICCGIQHSHAFFLICTCG